MDVVVVVALVAAGVVHLLPLRGALGGRHVEALYGVAPQDSDVELLLRHRSIGLGVLGGFLVVAAFVPSLRGAGLAVGLVSVVAFLVLARLHPGHAGEIARVVKVDAVLVVLLLAGVVAHLV